MKAVHGTFNSLEELREAIGFKAKAKKEQAKKCPVCGEDMARVSNTNVFYCGNPYLHDEKLGEQDVQVFGVCDKFVLSET